MLRSVASDVNHLILFGPSLQIGLQKTNKALLSSFNHLAICQRRAASGVISTERALTKSPKTEATWLPLKVNALPAARNPPAKPANDDGFRPCPDPSSSGAVRPPFAAIAAAASTALKKPRANRWIILNSLPPVSTTPLPSAFRI